MVRKLLLAVIAVAQLLGGAASFPSFGQTLRIAMTASDLPTTTGIPNNGGEGFRFLGFPAFDGLIDWDFTRPDQIAGLTPGLAASWKIDESDHTRSISSLRDGVAYHDGSALTADAVIWNRRPLDRDLHEVAVQLLPLQAPRGIGMELHKRRRRFGCSSLGLGGPGRRGNPQEQAHH